MDVLEVDRVNVHGPCQRDPPKFETVLIFHQRMTANVRLDVPRQIAYGRIASFKYNRRVKRHVIRLL